MRLLTATIGALLISVSHLALAQEHFGALPHVMWQQGEDSRQSEPQQAEQVEPQQPAMREAQVEQAEMPQPTIPEPQTEQAAMPQPAAMPEPQPAQAEVQQPAMPEPQTEQAAMPQPAMPEPQPAQAEMPQPMMPEPQAEQAEVQPPAMPEPQAEQRAAIQQPATPEPETAQPATQGMAQDIALPRDTRWTVFSNRASAPGWTCRAPCSRRRTAPPTGAWGASSRPPTAAPRWRSTRSATASATPRRAICARISRSRARP